MVRPPTQPRSRGLLLVAVVTTALLLLADLAGSAPTEWLRRTSIATFGPVERVLSGVDRGALAAAQERTSELATQLSIAEDRLRALSQVGDLLDSDAAHDHPLIPARVLGLGERADGGYGLTIDVGSRDGASVDSAVIAESGLVGRVVTVSEWTSDVAALGATGSPVAVRVGAAGALGWVGPSTSADVRSRPRGTLLLTLAAPGTIAPGDRVSTLGSVGNRPYVPGIAVGVVTDVDPDTGGGPRTATVAPAVDVSTLDVVGVLAVPARTQPRPTTGASR